MSPAAAQALAPPPASAPAGRERRAGFIVVEGRTVTPLGPLIVFADEAACRLTGYDADTLAGSPLGLVYDNADLGNLIAKLPRVALCPDYCWMDRLLIPRSGRRRLFHWTIRPAEGPGVKPSHFALTFEPAGAAAPARPADEQPRSKLAPLLSLTAASPAVLPEDGPVGATGGAGAVGRKTGRALGRALDDSIEREIEETRMESLALAAGGVAHDFKNSLQAIKSNVELALMDEPSGAQTAECLAEALHSIHDAEMLARLMLAVTRGEPPRPCVFDAGVLLRRVSRICTAGSEVRPEVKICPGLRPVEGNSARIYQVLHNLVINACQAMPGGGVLHLVAANADLAEGNPFEVPEGLYTVVSVRDRGCGIPAEQLPLVFDREFTTKEGGTGFGLASCKAIVEESGGAIRVASQVGVGTEFLVFLPSSDKSPELDGGGLPALPAAPCPAHPASRARGERVLVVDDEPAVAKVACKILQKLGYEAVSAGNGEEAVRVYRSRIDSPEAVDAVLLDMTLPGGLAGPDVLRELRQVDPEVRVVATSGHFGDEDKGGGLVRLGFRGVLPKPYSAEDLSTVVGAAMAG